MNADVGEGYDDDPLFDVVSSISVACGAHAGDRATMERCVDAAAVRGVAVGAHPSYPDRKGFGRAPMDMPVEDLSRSLRDQVEDLAAVASARGLRLTHVKPHGALYNEAAADGSLADLVARAVASVGLELRIVASAGSALLTAAEKRGLLAIPEGFADRRYRSDGRLSPRGTADALIEDAADAVAQSLAIARGDPIPTVDGSTVRIVCRTLCVHADTPNAGEIGRAVRRALENEGFSIAPFARP